MRGGTIRRISFRGVFFGEAPSVEAPFVKTPFVEAPSVEASLREAPSVEAPFVWTAHPMKVTQPVTGRKQPSSQTRKV